MKLKPITPSKEGTTSPMDRVLVTLKFNCDELASLKLFEQKVLSVDQWEQYRKWLLENQEREIDYYVSDPPREYGGVVNVSEIEIAATTDPKLIESWNQLKSARMIITENFDVFDLISLEEESE